MNRFFLLLLCVSAIPIGGTFTACSSSTTNVGVAGDGGGTNPDAGEASTDATTGGTMCTKARDDLLVPIDKVSTGTVAIISDSGGVKTLYVDATGGGINVALKAPRVYIDLAAGKRVDVTDKTAPMSTDWDLALKRPVIFTNSGDAGIGVGGAVQIGKPFASVSAADANAANVAKETFFDDQCMPMLDPTGAPNTTFATWYDYDQTTNIPTPKDVTYVVAGGTGKKYKVGIKAYDGAPDGGKGNQTGAYILQVSAL